MTIYAFFIIIEMLCINTYTTYSCSNPKYSRKKTLLLVCMVTVICSALFLLSTKIFFSNVPYTGKGLFFLFGFFYIPPLHFCFAQSLKNTSIIMIFSWIYTLSTYAIAVQISCLLPQENFVRTIFLVQTTFHLLSFFFFVKFVKRTFLVIMNKLMKEMRNSLLVISICWFLIIFLLNYIFIAGTESCLIFLLFALIILNTVLSYRVLYHVVSFNNKVESLSLINKHDTLTQLKNREGLYEDVTPKLEKNIPFTLIFIDLDDFKSINDTYGHAMGDTYLIAFSNAILLLLECNEALYRLHGDEFVLVTESKSLDSLLQKIEHLVPSELPENVPFKGLSYGYSTFPDDGKKLNDLLYLSDLMMYQKKKKKQRVTH